MDYIVIRKGEDSDFGGRTIRIDLSEINLVMTGWTATFKLGSITQNFAEFEEDKFIDLDGFKVPETFSTGIMHGYLQLKDEDDKVATVLEIPFKVEEKLI